MISARMDSLQSQGNTNRDSDRECGVFGRRDDNQTDVFEIIYVPDSVVWGKAPPSEDIQTQVLIESVFGRGFEGDIERKDVLDASIMLSTGQKVDWAGPGEVSKDLYQVPGHIIAFWVTLLKRGLDFDPIQEFQFHEISASTTAEPHMVLRETGSGWSLIVRKRSKRRI